MEHKGFRYDFTMKEIKYFLFNRKICPKCGGKLEKGKGYETVDGSTFYTRANMFFAPNVKVKHYFYIYKCQQCGSEHMLSDLAK